MIGELLTKPICSNTQAASITLLSAHFMLHNVPIFPGKWDLCIHSIFLSVFLPMSYGSFLMCCLISVMYDEGMQNLKMSGSYTLHK